VYEGSRRLPRRPTRGPAAAHDDDALCSYGDSAHRPEIADEPRRRGGMPGPGERSRRGGHHHCPGPSARWAVEGRLLRSPFLHRVARVAFPRAKFEKNRTARRVVRRRGRATNRGRGVTASVSEESGSTGCSCLRPDSSRRPARPRPSPAPASVKEWHRKLRIPKRKARGSQGTRSRFEVTPVQNRRAGGGERADPTAIGPDTTTAAAVASSDGRRSSVPPGAEPPR
jgi:hypothetical protein